MEKIDLGFELIKFKPIRNLYNIDSGTPLVVFNKDISYDGIFWNDGIITSLTPYIEDVVCKIEILDISIEPQSQ